MAKKKKKTPTKITQAQILKMERAHRRLEQLESGVKIVPRVHTSDKAYTRKPKHKKPPDDEVK